MSSSNKTLNPLTNASNYINIKLTIDNFLLWKAQIVPYLEGHQLFRYVDGSFPRPPALLDDKSNPAHLQWHLQDKLIVSTINSSLSDSVLAQVLDCSTSCEVWTTLQNLFAAKSSAHLIHTKYQLATLKKGAESITDYYNKARSLASTLSAAGRPLDDSELAIYLLAGLGTDYESLVTSLTTRPDALSPHQLFSYLLNHESRLSHQTQSLLSGTTIAAHNTTKIQSPNNNYWRGRGNNFRGGRGRGRGFGRGILPAPRPPQQTPQYFSPRSDSRPMCQVCNKPGHMAAACYHRYDHSYPTPPPATFAANYSALTASPSSSHTWFPDTAATHHFTADINNLNVDSSVYQGSDQVSIGDGSSIPIQHVGSASFSSNTGNFLLTNLLHVPSISRNLLSVRQFCQDNNVIFEFHSSFFLVKDACTQETLLQGPVEDGLYVFHAAAVPSSPSPKVFSAVRTSAQLWHSRLGHPSSRTTSLILQ
ncbi:hypothetical protein F2P56_016028 [Juglans regia]|uniref:Retrovirus-related Pol polyprotein from transposon TNT 1-94-like beta-barrel domain-containing protein n=1 Tax=Juglans regia TaxID=51240 RepID=A0A834CW47_JUGRE|nr:hypothetical protein F2P56_016028 [Juglans regia]